MGAVLSDTRRSITSWCRRHTLGGDGAVAARRRGTQTGEAGGLTPEQELELIDMLRGRWPEEHALDDELWSRRTVATLVERRFGLTLSPTDVGHYLDSWGLAPRKPAQRACGLCVDAVTDWVEHVYPEVMRSAREHRMDLWWLGRTRLHGTTPAADVLSAASVRGQIRFMILTPSLDPPLPREFLLRLCGPDRRGAHIVVDGSWVSSQLPRRLPRTIVTHLLPSCARTARTA
ncbi:winged helix-turn-helix domain-containing protein [Solwaraspora sp. WMMD406]|uniref:winged helix-turn-helix domain-containing protein n=1 Tax=Solwaraspora sp. WMMD406 TaxID=3016095 RepID=UPI00324202D0